MFWDARKKSDRENTRIEHDKVLLRVMTEIIRTTRSCSSSLWIVRTSSGGWGVWCLNWGGRGWSERAVNDLALPSWGCEGIQQER